MSSETLFYVAGITLAVAAVAVTFLGLRLERFPGRAAVAVGFIFATLVGCTTTFAVMHAQDEKEHEEAALEHANEEVEQEEGH